MQEEESGLEAREEYTQVGVLQKAAAKPPRNVGLSTTSAQPPKRNKTLGEQRYEERQFRATYTGRETTVLRATRHHERLAAHE